MNCDCHVTSKGVSQVPHHVVFISSTLFLQKYQPLNFLQIDVLKLTTEKWTVIDDQS